MSASEATVSFRDDNWPVPGECDFPIECAEPEETERDGGRGIGAEEPNEAPVADVAVEPPEPGITPETDEVKLVGRTGPGEVAGEVPDGVATADAHDADLDSGLPCAGTTELNR